MSFLKRTPKAARKDPADAEKSAGAREYLARLHDRTAERLASAGDAAGAEVERAAAEEARRPQGGRRPSDTSNQRVDWKQG
jgi:hypothetical protein